MKTIGIILGMASTLLARCPAGASPVATPVTNAPASIELHDQFNAPQKLTFPATNITLLTIADRKGSGEISDWVIPVKQHFGTHIDIRGIADVSCVPQPLHRLVQSRFRACQSYPVMMDWTGSAIKAFGYAPGKAEILVLDRQGGVLYRARGKADERAIQDLFAVLEEALSRQPEHSRE